MDTQRANDLRAFRDFATERLSNGSDDMTLEEALAYWEVENPSDEDRADTLRAIREGLADVDSGRTRPAEDVLRDLCRKHNLADPTR